MTKYYYEQLSVSEKHGYAKLLSALQNNECSISFGAMMSDKSLEKIARAVSFDHPELFYVDFQHLRYVRYPFGIKYTPDYLYNTSMRAKMRMQVEAKLDSIADSIAREGLKTPLAVHRWIHNYLLETVSYNYGALQNPGGYPDAFSCYGALMDGTAVCEGISKTYKLICDRVGEDALIIAGESKSPTSDRMIPHAWNCVSLNNILCHIDTTWDINLSEGAKANRYDYFCITDKDMVVDHVFSGYPQCNCADFSYFSQTGKLFNNKQSLKSYLSYAMNKKLEVIYFKILATDRSSSDLHDKIHQIFLKMLTQHATSSYSYQMIHNHRHNIFYYRIQW